MSVQLRLMYSIVSFGLIFSFSAAGFAGLFYGEVAYIVQERSSIIGETEAFVDTNDHSPAASVASRILENTNPDVEYAQKKQIVDAVSSTEKIPGSIENSVIKSDKKIESCLKKEGILICFHRGAIPSSTQELAVGLRVLNNTDQPVVFHFSDFSLNNENENHLYIRRTIHSFKKILKRLMWSDVVIGRLLRHHLDDAFTVPAGEEVVGMLRFYQIKKENRDKKISTRRPQGNRAPYLRKFEMPLLLTLKYKHFSIGNARLHIYRWPGPKNDGVHLISFGWEWNTLKEDIQKQHDNEYMPVVGYWKNSRFKLKLIEFAGQQFEMIKMKYQGEALFGKYVFEDEQQKTLHFKYLPKKNDEANRLLKYFDPKAIYTLSTSEKKWMLTSKKQTWVSTHRLSLQNVADESIQ